MSLRTSLQRLARRDPEKPSLRERLASATAGLAETKARAGKAAMAAKILMKAPEPEAPPVDRVALVNYASWLFMERRLVCAEIYPHLGAKADTFVMEAQPANDFHFPPGRRWQDVPQPSTRAVKILDMIGVDWRSDTDPDWGISSLADDGTRPAVPHGWPAVDAGLIAALGDLKRLDAAIKAVLPDDYDDFDAVPGFRALDEARTDALATLEQSRAQGLSGLQAKARAILTTSVRDNHEATADLAHSLARNLLGLRQQAIEPLPDPIFEAIEECRRLMDADTMAGTVTTANALTEHVDGVLLQTAPTTARGCIALARFAAEFQVARGNTWERAETLTLALIARSPLL